MSAPQKTPISVLNELAIKLKFNLQGQYLDHLSASTSEPARCSPIFVYQYECDRYFARGEGTAKKRAQHKAAENMLDILKRSAEYGFALPLDNVSLSSPGEIKVERDAVGPLTDYIGEFMLPPPTYQYVREEGPAHDKRFTARCAIPSYAVEATDRQKKQAKQQVALQMLTVLKNTIDPRANRNILNNPAKLGMYDFEDVMKKFPRCQPLFNVKYHPKDLSSPLVDDFTRYQDYCHTIREALDEFVHLESENPEEALDSTLDKINLDYNFVPVTINRGKSCMVVLSIQFAPNLTVRGMGPSYVEASRRAAIKAIDYMKILCSPGAKANEESSAESEPTEGTNASAICSTDVRFHEQ